ncbi:cytochrome c oxidase subunit II [Marinibaculum pumilum]|uniref:Cytochrome c oxidase subunit 2 n=1 Tax=Marinibaculum pumilum TaxID=1766165 RepID=A0ABV7KVU8_9PROT
MTQISVRGGGAAWSFVRQRAIALAGLLAFLALAMPGLAAAQDGEPLPADLETIGIAQPWQLGYQPAAAPIMDSIYDFHDLLLVVIFAISIFVLLLMLYVMFRFSASKNPNPSRTSHNTLVEVIWTVVPVLILVIIAIPSFRLLYFEDRTVEADLVVKATGHQWYWTYEYPDEGLVFDQLMVADADLKPGEPRLLETDTAVVVPVDKKVRVLTTASDVLHSWTIPSFGIKQDSVPGRINETWFLAERPGIYYGQCSELCGVNHAFMPIKVVAVEQADYDRWLAWAKNEYAAVKSEPRAVASAAETDKAAAAAAAK